MGKILETTYHDSVEKVTQFHGALIKNPFYSLSDKKPTIVTYYNINKEASTLDPGSKLSYDNIGKKSPLRFNKIDDFMLYGFTRIELNTENDEFGLEADKITGECYILPNTIKPTEGDYFEVDHITDSTWLFIVTDIQKDTLENGSNVYKITYNLEYVDHERLLEQVVGSYRMIEKREGTNIAKVVENTKYDVAKTMDEIAVKLKTTFNELFYNQYVQTFIYMDVTEWRIYDEYMIEFLIRNKILDNGNDSYIHVGHQLQVDKTFSIDYDNTLFRAFEKRDKNMLIKSDRAVQPMNIIGYGTTFSSRFETYFKARYTNLDGGYSTCCLEDDIIFRVQDHKLVEEVDSIVEDIELWKNIIVKHFYDEDFTTKEIESINNIRFDVSYKAFYLIPLFILCLETAIEKALK